jgi:hypothetical protein
LSAKLERLFPRLVSEGYTLTSDASSRYNCIAWAATDVRRWWWPDVIGIQSGVCFWPAGAPVTETLDAFIQAFQTLGYHPCADDEYEPGFEKIAIYVGAVGRPTHAARQLANGRWTSKLGSEDDIEHTLDGLVGGLYGRVAQVLRRAVPPR